MLQQPKPVSLKAKLKVLFLDHVGRIKNGKRLAVDSVKWDAEEECFVVHEHHIFFDRIQGWICDCKDYQYRQPILCKHIVSVLFYLESL